MFLFSKKKTPKKTIATTRAKLKNPLLAVASGRFLFQKLAILLYVNVYYTINYVHFVTKEDPKCLQLQKIEETEIFLYIFYSILNSII